MLAPSMSMIARRLWRFSFGPLSSTKTIREFEESLLSGHAGEDRVGDHMRDAARVGGLGGILLTGDLLAGRDVPQTDTGPSHAQCRDAIAARSERIARWRSSTRQGWG